METIVKNEEEVIIPAETGETVVEPVVPPGAKTDPALLLKSLQEERDERRKERDLRIAAETALAEARKASEKTDVEVFSDEGKVLQGQISELTAKLSAQEQKDRLKALQKDFPALVDKAQEFNDFRLDPENAGMKLETAAKAFLVENNLVERPQTRKGLEKETGGVRVVPKVGRTQEEIQDLRVNNYRQYVKELKAGTLEN